MYYMIEKYTTSRKGKTATKYDIYEFKQLSQLEKKLTEGPKHSTGKLIAAQELWYGIQVSITDLIEEKRKEEREGEALEKESRKQIRLQRLTEPDDHRGWPGNC